MTSRPIGSVWRDPASGRLVSHTLADPEVQPLLKRVLEEYRKDPKKLFDWYVERGILTPAGNLTKRYGGTGKRTHRKVR